MIRFRSSPENVSFEFKQREEGEETSSSSGSSGISEESFGEDQA